MGVQVVAHQRQALGLAVARMVGYGLPLARPVHRRALSGSVDGAPPAQRFHEQPDGAGATPHVFVVVGGGPAASALRPATAWGVRPCRSPDGSHRMAGRRDPAPPPSSPPTPPRSRADSSAGFRLQDISSFFSVRRTVSQLISVTTARVQFAGEQAQDSARIAGWRHNRCLIIVGWQTPVISWECGWPMRKTCGRSPVRRGFFAPTPASQHRTVLQFHETTAGMTQPIPTLIERCQEPWPRLPRPVRFQVPHRARR